MGPTPALARVLPAVCAHLAAEGGMHAPPVDAHPARVLTSYLLLDLRHSVLGDAALAGEATQAEAVLRSVFPARTMHRLQGLLTGCGLVMMLKPVAMRQEKARAEGR